MKNFLMTTALIAATSTGAMADDHAATAPFLPAANAMNVMASDFIGARVYVSEKDYQSVTSSVDGEWDDVGEVNDVIMTREGKIDAILIDVGGFLGLGEKTLAVSMDELKLVSDGEGADEYFVVFTASQAMLEEAPEFAPYDDMKMASEDVTAPTVTREGYSNYERAALTTEMMTGTRVYDLNDKWIGEVSQLLIGTDGQITDAIVDVGGFIGIGEKPVAVSLDDVSVLREDGGDDIRVMVDVTKESLEAMPEYTQ